MTLEYKILWIEDNPKSIRRDKRLLSEYISELGFNCQITDIVSFEIFEQEIGYDETSEFDLLLVDLDLGNQETKDEGNLIIQKIRDEKVYTEIIFYSSQYEELQKKLNEHFVEGIFTSSREELKDKVEQIIDVTIKKVQDVNNLRGLIMAEVAELDRIKEKIIIKGSNKIPDKAIEKYTLKKIKDSGTSNQNKAKRFLDDITNITFEKDLFKSLGFVDSDKKAKATGEILDKLTISNPITKDAFIQPYIDNILGKRNKFAHVEECDGVDEHGNTCKVIGDIPFTEEKCIEIRKEIRKYKKLLEEIYMKVEAIQSH